MKDYFEDAYRMYFDSAYGAAEKPFEWALWCAWGRATFMLEGGLNVIPGFKMLPDSLNKAKCLVNLFIQPMISLWYRNWESQEQHSNEEKEVTRRIAFENVQGFLGIRSEELTRIHLGLDKELIEETMILMQVLKKQKAIQKVISDTIIKQNQESVTHPR